VAAPTTEKKKPDPPADWAAVAIDELRSRANANELPAMEELARRLIQGVGVAKDPQAGAGWLLRAAEGGSAQAAFNVGVMYERGFVVERDSSKAVEWYRKAADGNMPAAKHNLALMLREGKGAPRDTKRAIELLQAAARQGMSASMFSLGDIYERGDASPRDPVSALAWFAIAAEFERQIGRGEDTPLSKTAEQRAQAIQAVLTPSELQRAKQLGYAELRTIAEALAPPKPSPPPEQAPPSVANASTPGPISGVDLPSWPKAPNDQVRMTQQALFDLRLLRDKPDGMIGPATRNAIRDFQRSAGFPETGEPSKDLYVAMRQAQARRDIEASSPLPMPPKQAPSASPPVSAAPVTAKGDPDAWPSDGVEQVMAIQRLLRELKMLADPADGQVNAATSQAIREYEKMAGLKETGEPSRAVFDSLKDTRGLMGPKTGPN
jgi:peptidoglycan hydrolase-like protein with peptidoglycan-binding domain